MRVLGPSQASSAALACAGRTAPAIAPGAGGDAATGAAKEGPRP
jgi:hypothetical protein